MKELRFVLENQPGTLAKIAVALGEARVNIDGVAALVASGEGQIRLVADDAEQTKQILQEQGVAVEEKEALAIDTSNHPGELGKLLNQLAVEGVDVESCYTGTDPSRVMLTVADLARAKQILNVE